MDDMPRPRPPFLHREVNRHGKTVWYVRVGKGARTRLNGPYGSPQFQAEYHAAVKGTVPAVPGKPSPESVAWLIDRYRASSEWSSLSMATRKQRENIFRQVIEAIGSQPMSAINRKSMMASRDSRKATPFQARHFMQAMRGLFGWAIAADIWKLPNPVSEVKDIKAKTEGYAVWTDADLARYRKKWPLGTKERVWLDVLFYTGLRRGDAVLFGPAHVKDGWGEMVTEKTGTEAHIPMKAELLATLKAGPVGKDTFVCGERGGPLTKESFGNLFREACNQAGVKKSAHGIRKASATWYANNGATVTELEALFAWEGGRMASVYTKKADKRRNAKNAARKVEDEKPGDAIPAPDQDAPSPE